MNIKDIFNKIFKKNNNSFDLVNLGSLLINIPDRNSLNNDKEKILLLDKYKKEYLELLKDKRTISSINLSTDNLLEKNLMNVDLLLKFCLDNEEKYSELFNSTINIYDYLENNHLIKSAYKKDAQEINKKIKSKKANLYINAIEKIDQEVTLKLIALIEIYNEKKIISSNKKNALINTINNFKNVLVIIINQKLAANLERNTYKNNINNYEQENILNKKINNYNINEIKIILDNLLTMTNLVLPNINDIEYNIEYIARLERELEIYVYTHKDDINKLREEL